MTVASPCRPNDPASSLKELARGTERIFIGLFNLDTLSSTTYDR